MYLGGGTLPSMCWAVEIVVEIHLHVFKYLYYGVEFKYSGNKGLVTKWSKYEDL